MQWKNAQSTYFLGCNASFKCPFLLRLVGFADSGGWWVGSRQSCRLSVMKNDNRTWNLFPMKTDYHVLNLVLTTEKVQGKMPLGGSILKIRGLSWGNSSWAWPHGLGMSPTLMGFAHHIAPGIKLLWTSTYIDDKVKEGRKGSYTRSLRVERSYPYMEAKYPSKFFCMKDIHEYKVPSKYSSNFLGLLHIGLQLQCYVEGDCGKPWVMASKCNAML